MDGLDEVLVTAGIVWLVVRQFRWRDAAGMPRTAAVLAGVGVVLLLQAQLLGGLRWREVDLLTLALEAVLAAGLGAVMGARYRLRRDGDRTLARLQGRAVALWALFVLLRVGVLLAAESFGARAAASTGALLLVFAANRAATAVVVTRRLRTGHLAAPEIPGDTPQPGPTRRRVGPDPRIRGGRPDPRRPLLADGVGGGVRSEVAGVEGARDDLGDLAADRHVDARRSGQGQHRVE